MEYRLFFKKPALRFAAVLLAAFLAFGALAPVDAAAKASITVSLSREPGAYLRPFVLKLEAPEDTKLYYTKNGKKPDTDSAEYTQDGITVTKDRTIRILAVNSGGKKYLTYSYRIIGTGNADDKTQKYYYNYLRNGEKKVYNAMCEAVKAQAPTAALYELNVTGSDMTLGLNAFYWDNPDLKSVWDNEKSGFYEYSGSGRAADAKLAYYTKSRSASKKRITALEHAAAEIAAGAMELPDDESKVRYVTDWLVYNTVYDDSDSDSAYTAYGALVEHKAVCKGYADAFTYLMQILGIPAMGFGVYINGDPQRYHAGNMVQIDGKWCNIDVTWTDSTSNIFCFDYYLTGDRTFEKTHTKVIDGTDLKPPVPQGATNSYNKKATAEDSGLWSFRYSLYSGAEAYIDTVNRRSRSPYSFLIKNSSKDVAYIQRTFDAEPETKYRFSAKCAYSGSSGAYIGKAFSYEVSEMYSGNKWKTLEYVFTTKAGQHTVELALYNGLWKSESKGSAWFSDIKLEKYENGEWVKVYGGMEAGSGYSNIFEVMKPVSSLEFSEIPDAEYTGKKIKPELTVKDGDVTLEEGVHYTVSYSANKKVGTARVTVTGRGIYTGTAVLSFEIVKQNKEKESENA